MGGPRGTASSEVAPLGSYGLSTVAFIENIRGKLMCNDHPLVMPKFVIASTGNSITAATYLNGGQQFVDVLAGQLERHFHIVVEHRNLGVAASNCGYNWMCTHYQGDGMLVCFTLIQYAFHHCAFVEDIIIDANPMMWGPNSHTEEACETMVRSELAMRQRPAVISMDVTVPRKYASDRAAPTGDMISKLNPYRNDALAVINAASFLSHELVSKDKIDAYYHDDVHPSAHGHKLLGNLIFSILLEAACNQTLLKFMTADPRRKSNQVNLNQSHGQGHCVLADSFSHWSDVSTSGVLIASNRGWSLAQRGATAVPDATAGVMKESKFSWMANEPGSSIEFVVNASSILIVYYSNRYRMGIVDVYLDGSFIRKIDAYFEGYNWNRSRGLNNMRWLLGKRENSSRSSELHTVRIVVSHESNKDTVDPRHEFQIISLLYFS